MSSLLVLAVDTSSSLGGVALCASSASGSLEALLAVRTYEGSTDHAERLLSEIDAALVEAGKKLSDVNALAVGVGPGSFTGVRVGVSTMKALALAIGAPLAAAGSLELMARAAAAGDALRVPLIDAKRGELFAAAYAPDGGEVRAPVHLKLNELAGFLTSLGTPCVLIGEFAARLPEGVVPQGTTIHTSSDSDHASAQVLAVLAAERIARGEVTDAATLEPAYVRPPDAALPKEPLRTLPLLAQHVRVECAAHGRPWRA